MDVSMLIKQQFQISEGGAAVSGSRRRRLWELSANTHCAVIGVCLPLAALRRMGNKVHRHFSSIDDYQLHSAAVQLARTRDALSEAIQTDLDKRHAAAIRRLRPLGTAVELANAWDAAVGTGKIAESLWAVLTHPACDALLAEQISQQMHMIQHQAGAELRLDIGRLHELQEENATLGRYLADTQARAERLLHDKRAEIDALRCQVAQLQTQLAGSQAALATTRERLNALQAVGERADVENLSRMLIWQGERNARLELENHRLRRASAEVRRVPLVTVASPPDPAVVAAPQAPDLAGQRILCVGGRERVVSSCRQAVERAGGVLLHHDGGMGDRFGLLDAALGAADLVICQTGCISHNAYWRVKDHCKRTGKPCAFVENPSLTGFMRGLQGVLQTPESVVPPRLIAQGNDQSS